METVVEERARGLGVKVKGWCTDVRVLRLLGVYVYRLDRKS